MTGRLRPFLQSKIEDPKCYHRGVNTRDIARLAFRFVLALGIVNLFADMTYEGGRSVGGPFLGSLGASAAIIGFVAGFGELMGYGLRFFAGYFADKSRQYWVFALLGYTVNMLAVPALALAGSWPVAAAFVILERTGRAIRRPAVESMLSHAGKQIGQGWVFGLNEALDQAGATIGPLIVALVLRAHGGYHHAFAFMLIPALLCLGSISTVRILFPRPAEFEEEGARSQKPGARMGKKEPGVTSREPESRRNFSPDSRLLAPGSFSKAYWLYCAAGALVAAGFADFALIAFHFQKSGSVSQSTVPVLYATAMGTSAIGSLVLGRLFDKLGSPILLGAFFLSAFFAPFVFWGGFNLALIGIILWGIGVAAQESSLKALLVRVVPSEKRSTAFGLFDSLFGVAWFLGSAAMGLLYGRSIVSLIALSVVLQLAALPVLFLGQRAFGRSRNLEV